MKWRSLSAAAWDIGIRQVRERIVRLEAHLASFLREELEIFARPARRVFHRSR